MSDLLFYLFAALAVLAGLMVAVSRNPVNAAMNMILSFVGMAALFVLLETYFLAVLQVLVYAGAIVVLFVFIVMLIDAEKLPEFSLVSYVTAGAAFVLLLGGSWFLAFGGHSGPFAALPAEAPASVAKIFGVELFTRHILAFQVVGFLLLIAMIGVIVISRKIAQPGRGGVK